MSSKDVVIVVNVVGLLHFYYTYKMYKYLIYNII